MTAYMLWSPILTLRSLAVIRRLAFPTALNRLIPTGSTPFSILMCYIENLIRAHFQLGAFCRQLSAFSCHFTGRAHVLDERWINLNRISFNPFWCMMYFYFSFCSQRCIGTGLSSHFLQFYSIDFKVIAQKLFDCQAVWGGWIFIQASFWNLSKTPAINLVQMLQSAFTSYYCLVKWAFHIV